MSVTLPVSMTCFNQRRFDETSRPEVFQSRRAPRVLVLTDERSNGLIRYETAPAGLTTAWEIYFAPGSAGR